MTREDIENIIELICPNDADYERPIISPKYLKQELEQMALEQEPASGRGLHLSQRFKDWLFIQGEEHKEQDDDLISREWLKTAIHNFYCGLKHTPTEEDIQAYIDAAPSVHPQEPKTGHCKECKYFEYDSVAKVDGIPLIVAHEICSRWSDGCKTKEDGYCFLFEPQESEDKE